MRLQITTPALTTSNLIKWVSAQQQQKPNTRCIFSVRWHYYSIALGCDARNAYKTMQNALYHGITFPRAWTWEREKHKGWWMCLRCQMENRHHELCESPDWMSVCVCMVWWVYPWKMSRKKLFVYETQSLNLMLNITLGTCPRFGFYLWDFFSSNYKVWRCLKQIARTT